MKAAVVSAFDEPPHYEDFPDPVAAQGDELVVEIGTLRRHVGLPRSMAGLQPARARLENRVLTVEMKEAQ